MARLFKRNSIIGGLAKELTSSNKEWKEEKCGYENIEAFLQHQRQDNTTLFSMSMQIINNLETNTL